MNENAILGIFPFVFIGFWLIVTTLLGFLSGWFSLQDRYPNRDERPLERLRMQSGMLGRGNTWNPWGAVSFGGCLRLDVCPGGLRVAVCRIFGPFERPFFVPWSEIAVEEKHLLFMKRYRLEFRSANGSALTVNRRTFKRIAASSPLEFP